MSNHHFQLLLIITESVGSCLKNNGLNQQLTPLIAATSSDKTK
jgi:hypothetical protein